MKMMLKKFRLYIFIYVILFSLSLLFNLISYKKYHINFNVYSDNVGVIESIIHNDANLSDPLFSSVYYARTTSGQYLVGLKSNNLDDAKIFMEKLRKEFQYYSIKKLERFYISASYFLDSMDMNVRYDQKKIQNLIITNQKFFNDITDKINKISRQTDTSEEIMQKSNEKFLKRVRDVFEFEDKDIENIDNLIKYLIYYISDRGISDLKIEINKNKLISLNEIIISIIFSFIFTITFYSVRKI